MKIVNGLILIIIFDYIGVYLGILRGCGIVVEIWEDMFVKFGKF